MRTAGMAFYDYAVVRADGTVLELAELRDTAVLVVNVASKCGYTPQYEGLESLHREYSGRGFTVLGLPCNQFLFQEPGSASEIQSFCQTQFGVSFPVLEKIRVTGRHRHPLYAELSQVPDAAGRAGRVRWNFEKILIGRDGTPRARFRSRTTPDDPALRAAVEAALAG